MPVKDNLIIALANLMKYPEHISSNTMDFTFAVDGYHVRARQREDGRLILSAVLAYFSEAGERMPELLQRMSVMALGRIMREKEVLSYDPEDDALILWSIHDTADRELLYGFEAFLSSFEWWNKRVQETLEPEPVFPEILIRP